MARSIGDIVNSGLRALGEPSITTFDADNALHQLLISAGSNCVSEVLARSRYEWGLKRGIFTTTAEITTGHITVTNGSTTGTSKTTAGVDADNFGSVTTDMYLRRTSDNTSYKISSIDTASSPDTVTLETNYVGTTATSGYAMFQDEYTLSNITDLGEIKNVLFGEKGASTGYRSGDNEVDVVSFNDLVQLSGGDLHGIQSTRPSHMAQIGVDASNNPLFKVWPYPDSIYLMEIWYVPKFTKLTDFNDNLFGGDAPDMAEIAVENRVTSIAYGFDEDDTKESKWEARTQAAISLAIRGSTKRPNQARVITGRRTRPRGIRMESQHLFDTETGYGYG